MSHSATKTLIVVALLNAVSAQAQFKKYRTKTTFNESNTTSVSPAQPPMDAMPADSTTSSVAPAIPMGDDD